jgi:hypothetical protein
MQYCFLLSGGAEELLQLPLYCAAENRSRYCFRDLSDPLKFVRATENYGP